MKTGSWRTKQALQDPRNRSTTGAYRNLEILNTEPKAALGQTIEPLLTVAEAASFLRIHPRTLYDWVQRGRLPCLRAGGRIRFTREMLIRWLRGERRL